MTPVIGWLSSAILLLTIATQVHRQWSAGSSKGVSKWLFIGQIAASMGFTVYSWLVHDRVFVVTNALMLLSAAVGLGILLHHRRRESGRGRAPRKARADDSVNDTWPASKRLPIHRAPSG